MASKSCMALNEVGYKVVDNEDNDCEPETEERAPVGTLCVAVVMLNALAVYGNVEESDKTLGRSLGAEAFGFAGVT